MEHILKFLKENHKDIKNAVIPTIVVTCIFFINYFFFGVENTIIGPCVTLSYLYFRGMSNHFASMIKTFFIYLAIAVLAWAAALNLPLCVVINAGVLFWIVYGLNDEYHPTNYYTPGMAFILFQLSGVNGFSGVMTRLEALTASFAITFVFLIVIPAKKNKYTVRSHVREGLGISEKLLAAYRLGQQESAACLQEALRRKNEQICDEIYLHNYASFSHTRKVNWYCRFVALFQVFTTLTEEPDRQEKAGIMENLLKNFSALFQMEEQVGGKKKLQFRSNRPDIRSFRLRFALRQVLIMTPCLVYAYLCPWGNGYWLPVSVFFMLVPLYENMPNRVGGRLRGTLAGVVLCFILYSVFPGQTAHIAIMMIFNFLIYSSTGYGVSVAYITCAVLALNITADNIVFTLIERLIYTFGGAGLTVLASKFIFPVRIKPEAAFLQEKLSDLRRQMEHFTAADYPDAEERRHQKDQLLVKSYLLSRRLRLYNESLREDERDGDLMRQLNEHMMFMSYYLVHHFIGVKGEISEE